MVNEQPSLASLIIEIIDSWNNWAFGRNDHATHVPRGTVADIERERERERKKERQKERE